MDDGAASGTIALCARIAGWEAAINEALNAAVRVPARAADEIDLSSPGSPAETRTEADRQEWRIIALTSVGHALCHAAELTVTGMFLALMADFDLAENVVTSLGMLGFLLMGVGAVPVGYWTDRWGSRRVLTVYFFGLAAAGLVVALAPTAWALAAALTGLGAALSLYHPAALAMIAHGCRRRGRAMGINGVAGSIGIAVGPSLGILAVKLGSWQLAYLFLGGLSLISGIAMLCFRFEEAAETTPAPEANGTAAAPARPEARGIWLLYLAMMLGGFNYRSLTTALPTYLETFGRHADVLCFLILAVGGCIGQFGGGHHADRAAPARLYVILIAAMVPLALLMALGNQVVFVLAAAVLAVCMFAQQPLENTILAGATSARRRSTLYGLKFMLSFGVGALGAQVVGFVWQETNSLAPVFSLIAASALLMAGVAACFRRRFGTQIV